MEALALDASRAPSVRVVTTRGDRVAGQVVLAAGCWTPALCRNLGLRLPVEPAKGYSIDVASSGDIVGAPVLLVEASTVLTPFAESLRIGSILELTGWDMTVHPRRLARLQHVAARAVGSRAAGLGRRVWRGLRPLSPDGLPFVGRCPGSENVMIATGHGMLGSTLGPISGRPVADLADGVQPALDLSRRSRRGVSARTSGARHHPNSSGARGPLQARIAS